MPAGGIRNEYQLDIKLCAFTLITIITTPTTLIGVDCAIGVNVFRGSCPRM